MNLFFKKRNKTNEQTIPAGPLTVAGWLLTAEVFAEKAESTLIDKLQNFLVQADKNNVIRVKEARAGKKERSGYRYKLKRRTDPYYYDQDEETNVVGSRLTADGQRLLKSLYTIFDNAYLPLPQYLIDDSLTANRALADLNKLFTVLDLDAGYCQTQVVAWFTKNTLDEDRVAEQLGELGDMVSEVYKNQGGELSEKVVELIDALNKQRNSKEYIAQQENTDKLLKKVAALKNKTGIHLQ